MYGLHLVCACIYLNIYEVNLFNVFNSLIHLCVQLCL
jgi:hypothetical protein